MRAIKGIYDGKKIKPLEKIPVQKNTKVIITFIEEDTAEEKSDIRALTSASKAFDFWYDEQENLYQDYLDQSDK
jgi:hypothetical protein